MKVIEKPLGTLTDEDKKGHESFRSDEEMFKTYEQYYCRKVERYTHKNHLVQINEALTFIA